MPYRLPTRLLRASRPLSRLTPSAATPSSGRPTPVNKKPTAAGHMCDPAICPMETGKIRLPAPKNKPNSMLATTMISRKVSFFIMMILISFCQTTIILYDSWGHGKSCQPVLLLITGSAGKKIYVIMMNHHRFSFFWRQSAMCVRMGMKCTCDMKAENKPRSVC